VKYLTNGWILWLSASALAGIGAACELSIGHGFTTAAVGLGIASMASVIIATT